MTPWPLATAMMAPIAGWLADSYPAGILGGVGLGIFGIGVGLLGIMAQHPTTAEIAWRVAVCGLGFGLFRSPNHRAIIASAPRDRSGAASGMLGTARLLGQAIGAALVVLLFNLSAGMVAPLAVASG